MNQTTKTISLVLISSTLAFIGWGCPMGHEEKDGKHAPQTSHRYGHSMFWFHPYGYYGGGYGGRAGPSGPTGSSSSGHSGNVSSRGGFGSTGGTGGFGGHAVS